MLTNYLIIFLTVLLMSAILTHPAVCVTGAASGLLTWFNSVLPSLFPFMVLTGLLIRTGALPLLEKKCKQIPSVRRLPITAIFAVITGLLCGYPMGIRTVSELKNSGQLTERQARTLYSFVNQPGPMFVLGYALPLCGFSSGQEKLFLIAFYGGVGFTAVLALTVSRIESGILRKASVKNSPAAAAPAHIKAQEPAPHFLTAFEDVLLSSMVTLGKIGGYMMLFSLVAALIKELLPKERFLCLMFSGILEMTSGLALVPSAASVLMIPHFALAFTAFGGLSVAAQSFSLGGLTTGEQLRYLLWKAVQAVLTVLSYQLLCFYFL